MKYLILVLFLLMSCGSKKTASKEVSKIEKKDIEVFEDYKRVDLSVKETAKKKRVYTIKQRDTTKPIIINKDTISNAIIDYKEETENTTESKNVVETKDTEVKDETETESEDVEKEMERDNTKVTSNIKWTFAFIAVGLISILLIRLFR